MSTTKIEASGVPFVTDGPNSGTKPHTTITEAQVIAFLHDRALEVKQKFGVDKYAVVSAEVALYDPKITSALVTRIAIGSGAMSVHCFGNTFAEAWVEANDQSPKKQAQLKREQATRLLAEAEALAPVEK